MISVAASLDSFRSMGFNPRTPGFSPQADIVKSNAEEACRQFGESRVSAGPHSTFFQGIAFILNECAEEDWDGYDAKPVLAEAIVHAIDFLINRLGDISYPEIVPEPDGQVALEWYGPGNSSFSISFDGNNNISYACVLTENRERGFGSAKTVDTKIIRRHVENVLRAKAAGA